jgi:hypothetical protein
MTVVGLGTLLLLVILILVVREWVQARRLDAAERDEKRLEAS